MKNTKSGSGSKPKLVARYIRVSTLEQAKSGYSLDGQKESLDLYIQSNEKDKDWMTKDTLLYIDDGFSGADDERPAYRKMMEDAAQGKFNVLLVWKIDRLFRKTILLLEAIETLKNCNVEFVSKNESIDTSTATGRFSLTVLAAIAEMERETIRERTIMGKIAGAKKGYYVGGKYPPFGYDVKNKKMVINRDEAKIVKEIFNMFVNEKRTQTEIAKILTARRVPTKSDRMGVKRRTNNPGFWGQASISDLLEKDEYSGTYFYGKRETYLNEEGKTRQRLRPRDEWIPFNCPNIVDKKLFDKARLLVRENETYSVRDSDHIYLLRSKVYCGACGGRYKGYPKKKDGKVYHYYHCSRKNPSKSEKPCKNKEWSELKLDAIVWEPIDHLLKDPKEAIAALDKKIQKESKAVEYELTIKEHSAELEEKEREQERLASALRRGTLKEKLYDKQVAEIDQESLTLQDEIDRLHRLLQAEKEKEELKNSLGKLAGAYKKKFGKISRKTKESIIRMLVNRITINPSGEIAIDYAIPKVKNRVNKYGGDAGNRTRVQCVAAVPVLSCPIQYSGAVRNGQRKAQEVRR